MSVDGIETVRVVPWANIEDHLGFEGAPHVGPWVGVLQLDGRWMRITIVRDDNIPVCSERDYVRLRQCRFLAGHDGPHIPFSDEAICRAGPLAVTAIQSASMEDLVVFGAINRMRGAPSTSRDSASSGDRLTQITVSNKTSTVAEAATVE